MHNAVLIDAMARVPSPVTVVTTADSAGRRWGFTATSFTSLSLDPPLVLVCLNRTASTHPAFTSARQLMINVLAHEHADVARRFACRGTDRFSGGDMEPCELGLPGLPDACVRVACSMYGTYEAGDHTILIGSVENTYVSDRMPLVYCDRSYTYPAAVPQ
jgi:flavin reductase ActVB